MAYRNDATERARLHKLWIDELDLPCVYCGSKSQREIHHANGNTSITDETECVVACRPCHLAKHPCSKFVRGDKVRLRNDGDIKHGIPDRLDFTDYDKSRPRTIIKVTYDTSRQCNIYRLGSNGKGKMLDGQPLEGFDYEFRSYQLIAYEPRRYHFKRAYHRSALSNPSVQKLEAQNTRILTDASKPSCWQSQEIEGK